MEARQRVIRLHWNTCPKGNLVLSHRRPALSNSYPHSPFAVAKLSLSRRHWLLTAASVVILWSAVFSSLAGSLFVVRLATISTTTSVALAGALGLNTIALGTPSTFASAAGVCQLDNISSLRPLADAFRSNRTLIAPVCIPLPSSGKILQLTETAQFSLVALSLRSSTVRATAILTGG